MRYKRLVVKVGSGFLFDRGEDLRSYRFRGDQLDALAEEAAEISRGREIVIVSSGAIAMAASERRLPEIPADPDEKAELAGEGQPVLFLEYKKSLKRHGKRAAQCLITYDDIGDPRRGANLIKHQEGYFRKGVIAVYNENDFVATDEITFGDNDILAAMLARAIDANLLVMLSNPTEGLGTGGGKSKTEARKIAAGRFNVEILNDRYESVKGIYLPKVRELLC